VDRKGEARVAAKPPRFAEVGFADLPAGGATESLSRHYPTGGKDILLSGRQRAEGFPAVAVAVV